MTDREYLELAAKAAGIDVRWYQGDCLRVADKCNGFAGKWNPLADSGQALELAVKLAIDFKIRNGATWWDRQVSEGVVYWCHEPHNGDPLAATRRAIVMAAAEIGKGTKPFPTAEEIREEWT